MRAHGIVNAPPGADLAERQSVIDLEFVGRQKPLRCSFVSSKLGLQTYARSPEWGA